jgi:WD repeat and SOF domain-containing protein 1
VYALAKDPRSLERFASGSGDGVVKVWDLPSKDEVWQTRAHENIVKSCCWTLDQKLLTCAADRAVRLFDPYGTPSGAAPLSTWLTDAALTSISHHRSRNAFAAASSVVAIYDLERHSAAPEVLRWPTSADTINCVAFNPVETSVLASCATDRSVVLYDLRTSTPLAKSIHMFANNAIAWNPQIAFNFALASENHDVNIFDMRKMDRALNVLKGHVAGEWGGGGLLLSGGYCICDADIGPTAVMDVEFSPTGEELVSASYDRTIRRE